MISYRAVRWGLCPQWDDNTAGVRPIAVIGTDESPAAVKDRQLFAVLAGARKGFGHNSGVRSVGK